MEDIYFVKGFSPKSWLQFLPLLSLSPSPRTHLSCILHAILIFIFLFVFSVVERVFLSPYSLYRRSCPCFFPSFPYFPCIPPLLFTLVATAATRMPSASLIPSLFSPSTKISRLLTLSLQKYIYIFASPFFPSPSTKKFHLFSY